MISSNSRKLLLSGWLMENGKSEYDSPLRLQKFLANCNNKLSIQLARSLLFEEDPAQLRREP